MQMDMKIEKNNRYNALQLLKNSGHLDSYKNNRRDENRPKV